MNENADFEKFKSSCAVPVLDLPVSSPVFLVESAFLRHRQFLASVAEENVRKTEENEGTCD
jgi:hypothetical protein